ncbi:MAG: hypothetical protein KAJ79_05415, partial [Candidatus Omnitrophica bacterium]|nr:hypothetical protein [Candidatus Omnitrophota bacterium]
AAETAAFIYDDDVYIDKIIKILWGAQTVRAPNPIKKNLKELDEEFLKDLMQKREWKEKEYREISPALKLIWIKSALEEIRDSLNEDNSRKPDECKKHIQITIDKIEGHLDKYHWGIDLKLIDDEDNKIQQWEEELERLEEEKAASNKWKDKEELTRFIEKQAEECRKTNGDGDDFWIQRRANIRVLSGLTNLKGVKIGNKSGFEFIKELLEDKMNEENEKDIRVRKVAEELYPLFIAKNPDSIDDLDKLAEEEISTVGVLSVKERKEQIIDKIAGLEREITTRLKLHSLGQRTDGEMNEELQQAINFIGKYLMAQGKAYIEPLGRVEVLRMKSFIIDKVAFNNKKLEGKKAKLEMDKEFKIETGYPKAWVKGARSGWTNNMRFYTHSFVLILDENMNDPIEFLESLLDQVPLIEGVVGEWEFIIKRKIVEFLLKRLGLYGILGDVHELEKEVELPAPDKKYIALDYSSNNNHHSVNIVLVTYTNGKYRRILEKQNIGEGKGLIISKKTGIIRISEDKEVYIQYATQIGNYYFKIIIGGEDKLCAHKSKYKISTQSISIEEAYGEVHSGKSIVSLGVEYWMNERLKTRDEELLDEQKTILEKIKGYFKYENPELPEKKVWNIRALALRVYQLVGGEKEESEQAKQLIRERISFSPTEIQIAVLPDETLIPINLELLDNDAISAEYVERLFEILPGMIEKKVIGLPDHQITSQDIDYIDYAKLNEADYIEKVIEQIESLESNKPEDTETVEKLIELLIQLKSIVEFEGGIEIITLNYGLAWEEYYQAV